MDELKSRPGFPGDRSQAAAEKLRALRERANQALEGHRSRLGELESQLSERVRQLAEEFGASLNATPDAAPNQEEKLAELRRQVAEGNARHEKFVEQLAAARKQFEAIQSQPCVTCQQAADQLAAADEEQRRLRDELEAATRAHQEDCARHEQFVDQLAAARQAINVLQHAAGESSAELRAELEAARQAKLAAETQLAAATRDLSALHSECDAMRAKAEALEHDLQEHHQQTISFQEQAATLDRDRNSAEASMASLRAEVDALNATLAAAEVTRDELVQTLVSTEDEKQSLAASLATLEGEQGAQQAAQAGLVEALAAAEAEAQQARDRLKTAETERLQLSLAVSQADSVSHEFKLRLAAAEDEAKSLREESASLREQAATAAKTAELETELAQANAVAQEQGKLASELAAELDAVRQELAEVRGSSTSKSDLEAARKECQAAQAAIAKLEAAVGAAQAETAEAQAAIAAAEAETADVRKTSRTAEEYAELEHKFELAVADAHKLKRENSTLREDLAARPEASDQESPELVAVRTERDALATRMAEFEAAAVAAAALDDGTQQEREDLQRRFEMAVDDVRQLKQENAKLREQLAAAGKSQSGGGADAAALGSDWAAQKARLMAMLAEEDEDGEVSEERAAERATVANTIAATDRVIADRDHEIAELRAALESRGEARSQQDAAAEAQREEVLSGDELIAAERERLAKLTIEWEEKLRAAELEFSIERAKLAREQAAVRDRILEIQSGNVQVDNPGDPGKPRRRWLAALGLHDESDDGKKK
jgi:chromosome segregation ATPase